MREAGRPDCLTIVNGPEDGTEFALTRAPFALGTDPDCGVCPRLDRTIQPVHARGWPAPDGYRVRCASGAPVYVNGKRAGLVRSRMLRDGDILMAGHTEFVLECAPDGLAGRSRGLVFESDAVWALRAFIKGAFRAGAALVGLAAGLLGMALRRWKGLATAAAIGLFFVYPPFRGFVYGVIHLALGIVRTVLGQLGV